MPLVAGLVIAAAVVTQAATGSGFGVVASPLLVLLDHHFVPGPLLCVTMIVMLGIVRRERRALALTRLSWALVAAVPAAVGGLLLVPKLTGRATSFLIGLFVVVSVAASMLGWQVRAGRAQLAVAGGMAGFLGSVAAVPGPPLVVAYADADAHRYRANLSAFFALTAGISVLGMAARGDLDTGDLALTVVLLPGVVVGLVAAHMAVPRLPERALRPLALTLSLCAGLVLLIRTVVA
ncbi:MAG: TSUP family transporter [Nocardioides sp.]|uniref:TSUP family transporter n=1 Tax=Nocardioides sp. TaxID=35761 RepID=UPI0039E3974B